MADSNLTQLIKRAAVEAVEASKPCDYTIGTVVGKSPLSVKLSHTLTIDRDFIDLLSGTGELDEGDRVMLLRKAKGQRYALLGKVVG